MARTIFVSTIFLGLIGTAFAGPMPQLPDLPPLPESYTSVGAASGAYAGLLGGLAIEGTARGAVGVVAGTAMVGDTVVAGLEAMGLLEDGSATVEAGLRLGISVTDIVGIFSQASLGADSENGMFVGLGGSVDYRMSESLTLRGQYRHALDLSGDAGKDLLLIGAVFNF